MRQNVQKLNRITPSTVIDFPVKKLIIVFIPWKIKTNNINDSYKKYIYRYNLNKIYYSRSMFPRNQRKSNKKTNKQTKKTNYEKKIISEDFIAGTKSNCFSNSNWLHHKLANLIKIITKKNWNVLITAFEITLLKIVTFGINNSLQWHPNDRKARN